MIITNIKAKISSVSSSNKRAILWNSDIYGFWSTDDIEDYKSEFDYYHSLVKDKLNRLHRRLFNL